MTDFDTAKTPTIYAYSDVRYPGMLKVGYTTRAVDERMKEHYPTKTPKKSYKVVFSVSAIDKAGKVFTDHAVHRALGHMGIRRKAGEWFACTKEELKAAVTAVRNHTAPKRAITQDYPMRPEQEAAVAMTVGYFKLAYKRNQTAKAPQTPRFLWNAKMRFGKTHATYQLARRLGWQRILVLTYKPAVAQAWRDDLGHVDFEGWRFIDAKALTQGETVADNAQAPLVYFASFQDILGKDKAGNPKDKNRWLYNVTWDGIVVDEYHFGAWRKKAQDTFSPLADVNTPEQTSAPYPDDELEELEDPELARAQEVLDAIDARHMLCLSGTPFRALSSGEFMEEQIFNWTYADEQHAKATWDQDAPNPYATLPHIKLLTYRLSKEMTHLAQSSGRDEFDLNEFFRAQGTGENARFKHEEYVQKWLDFIRYANIDKNTLDNPKDKPALPFDDKILRGNCAHTLWFLPNVASCDAMANLLSTKANIFYHSYQVVNAAGTKAGIGIQALPPVLEAMGANPLATQSITLTCGKLLTGVSVAPWTGILMLRNLKSPETYFQAAFRVQTPWALLSQAGESIPIKSECYIFDFAPKRALKQIVEYSEQLDTRTEVSRTDKIARFLAFLPILASDGGQMIPIDAKKLLEISMGGVTASMLARRWQSSALVNVDTNLLASLAKDSRVLDAINRIEGFAALGSAKEDTTISQEELLKTLQTKETSEKTKKQQSAEEKEVQTLIKKIRAKLLKFTTRIPIFMYLSDYREERFKDVVTRLEPELFTRVTGLSQSDFQLFISLGIFNEDVLDDAVYKFKCYEDPSTLHIHLA